MGSPPGPVTRSLSDRDRRPQFRRPALEFARCTPYSLDVAEVEHEVQYLILGESAQPYLLARVRWPDVAQAISEDCPGWLDDPGLFDLPYEPVSQRVSSSRAAEIAADWGAELPLASSAGFSQPRIRRVPPSWSDMVPVERWSWSLEHLAMVRRTEPSHRSQWPEESAGSSNGHGMPTRR